MISNRKNKFDLCQKELSSMVTALGFKLKFYKNKKNHPSGHGEFDHTNQTVIIRYSPATPKRRLLYLIAHEARHAIHLSEKLFSDYYREEHYAALTYFGKYHTLPPGYIPPDLSIGVRAERDCDRWAINFLRKYDIKIKITEYRRQNVMGYLAWIEYLNHKKDKL